MFTDFTIDELNEMKENLLKGFKLDTSIGSIYTGKLTKEGMKIIDVIRVYNDNQHSDKKCIFKIRNRVYIIDDKGVMYYSLKGIGKFRYLNNWRKFFDFITKPSKNKKDIKMYIIDKDIDSHKFIKENIE